MTTAWNDENVARMRAEAERLNAEANLLRAQRDLAALKGWRGWLGCNAGLAMTVAFLAWATLAAVFGYWMGGHISR
jgi:hypothetical protein